MTEHEKIMADFNEMINGNKPVLVDFYATWCGPCQTMQPVLEELKETVGDKAHILKLDIENRANIKVVQKFRVRSVPTLMIFREGEIKWSASGARSASELRELISRYE